MKRLMFLFSLLIFALPATAQNNHCFTIAGGAVRVSCAFSNPQKSGDTLIVATYPPGGTLTDVAGDKFTLDATQNGLDFFSAINLNANASNALVFTPPSGSQYEGVYVNEQTGQWVFDALNFSTVYGPGLVTISTVSPATDLAYAWLGLSVSNVVVTSGAGFTLDNKNGWAFDETGVGNSASFNYPSTAAASLFLVNYKSAVPPPPPPPPINLIVQGNLLYDDSTPVASGIPILVQQLTLAGPYVNAGTIVSDTAGNLTGGITIDPNQANTSGSVTFQFGISGIPLGITQSYPIQEFQQGSTGVNLGLILFKTTMLPKSFSAGLLP